MAIVIFAAVVLPVNGQQNGSKTGNNAKGSKQTNWTVPCTVKQDETTPDCDWSKAVPDSYLRRLFSPESAPNIALFVVGVAGIFVALMTLGKLERQTKSTEDAANAAYGSVTFAEAQWQLTREKERARLEVTVKPAELIVESDGDNLRHLIATLKIRNIGESKAYIRRTNGTLITKAPDAPDKPGNGFNSLSLPESFIKPHEDAIEVPIYLIPDDIKIQMFADCLEQSKFSLHLFGFIEYETLGLCYRKEFIYSWLTGISRSVGAMLGLDQIYFATDKNRIMMGFWWTNDEKPEYPVDCCQSNDESQE